MLPDTNKMVQEFHKEKLFHLVKKQAFDQGIKVWEQFGHAGIRRKKTR